MPTMANATINWKIKPAIFNFWFPLQGQEGQTGFYHQTIVNFVSVMKICVQAKRRGWLTHGDVFSNCSMWVQKMEPKKRGKKQNGDHNKKERKKARREEARTQPRVWEQGEKDIRTRRVHIVSGTQEKMADIQHADIPGEYKKSHLRSSLFHHFMFSSSLDHYRQSYTRITSMSSMCFDQNI